MVATDAFAAGTARWGLSAAWALIAVLAALVVTVITSVNRIERRVGHPPATSRADFGLGPELSTAQHP